MDPSMVAALGGLLSSFGGGGGADGLKDIFRFLMTSARGARRYGNSPAMSAPGEQLALAGARGNAGELLNQQRQRTYAAAGSELAESNGDRVANLNSRDASQLLALDSEHFLNSLNNRFRMRFQTAPGIAASAMGAANGMANADQGGDLSGILGRLAQTYAFSQARTPSGGGAAATAPGVATPQAPRRHPAFNRPAWDLGDSNLGGW